MQVELQDMEINVKQLLQGVQGIEKLTIIGGLFKNFGQEDESLLQTPARLAEYLKEVVRIYSTVLKTSVDP